MEQRQSCGSAHQETTENNRGPTALAANQHESGGLRQFTRQSPKLRISQERSFPQARQKALSKANHGETAA